MRIPCHTWACNPPHTLFLLDTALQSLDFRDGSVTAIPLPPTLKAITALHAVSADASRAIVSTGADTWHVELSSTPNPTPLPVDFATAAAFLPDQSLLIATMAAITTCSGSHLQVALRLPQGIPSHQQWALAPDGAHLALPAPNGLAFYDLRNGHQVDNLVLGAPPDAFVVDPAWRHWAATTHQGRRLTTAGRQHGRWLIDDRSQPSQRHRAWAISRDGTLLGQAITPGQPQPLWQWRRAAPHPEPLDFDHPRHPIADLILFGDRQEHLVAITAAGPTHHAHLLRLDPLAPPRDPHGP